jgi:uroporphyrinogen-III synthase
MSRSKTSSTKHPLQGVRVLVGRARHQAGALSTELRKRGAEVLEIPFIEIRKPRSFRPLDSALKNLPSYDWLILTSVNGVEAMWDRLKKLRIEPALKGHRKRAGREVTRAASGRRKNPALAAGGCPSVAAIGPATKKAIEQRGIEVDVVPTEYVAESVVRSLKSKVKDKRVLLVRAKVARDVIPRELRKAGARVDVVEAYETVVPQSSRRRLRAALKSSRRSPNVVTFTSSSTVKNFVELVGRQSKSLDRIQMASIGPVTSATLRDLGLPVDIAAREFTIPGLITAIVDAFTSSRTSRA